MWIPSHWPKRQIIAPLPPFLPSPVAPPTIILTTTPLTAAPTSTSGNDVPIGRIPPITTAFTDVPVLPTTTRTRLPPPPPTSVPDPNTTTATPTTTPTTTPTIIPTTTTSSQTSTKAVITSTVIAPVSTDGAAVAPSPQASGAQSKQGATAIIIIGVLAILVIIGVAACLFRRARKKREMQDAISFDPAIVSDYDDGVPEKRAPYGDSIVPEYLPGVADGADYGRYFPPLPQAASPSPPVPHHSPTPSFQGSLIHNVGQQRADLAHPAAARRKPVPSVTPSMYNSGASQRSEEVPAVPALTYGAPRPSVEVPALPQAHYGRTERMSLGSPQEIGRLGDGTLKVSNW